MQRCPSCNARLRERTVCSRCKADLTIVFSIQQAAELWLSKAIQNCHAENIEQSITAINLSLTLKKTRLALVFREYLIAQQCREALELLAQRKLQPARQKLYSARRLFPYSSQLQQLDSYSDYLLVKHPEYF